MNRIDCARHCAALPPDSDRACGDDVENRHGSVWPQNKQKHRRKRLFLIVVCRETEATVFKSEQSGSVRLAETQPKKESPTSLKAREACLVFQALRLSITICRDAHCPDADCRCERCRRHRCCQVAPYTRPCSQSRRRPGPRMQTVRTSCHPSAPRSCSHACHG